MANKYKTALRFIGFLLILFIFLFIFYQKYKVELQKSSPLVVVEDGISINYLQGNKIETEKEKTNYSFSITNNSTTTKFYYISLNDFNTTNHISYLLTEKKNVFENQGDITTSSIECGSLIAIEPNATHFYTLTIFNTEKNHLTFELKIGLEEEQEEYFANILLKNNPAQTADTLSSDDLGLFLKTEENETIYYFRGNVENNYVSFANLLWRIVKINSDGSVRLILNDYADITSNFYESASSKSIEEKLDLNTNEMALYLEDWYERNLKEFESQMISQRYCLEEKSNEDETIYQSIERLEIDKNPRVTCQNSITKKLGLLSADEVYLAGGSIENTNTNFYLYLPNKVLSWWTLTPSKSSNNEIIYYEVSNEGRLLKESYGSYFKGVRPVINLIKRTEVTGEGTLQNPYTIK